MADVCDDLKARRGCGSGSRHEIFMKKHCKKTCGFCGMYNITRTRVVLIKSFEVRLNPSLFFFQKTVSHQVKLDLKKKGKPLESH